jgi:hypothetical protein
MIAHKRVGTIPIREEIMLYQSVDQSSIGQQHCGGGRGPFSNVTRLVTPLYT